MNNKKHPSVLKSLVGILDKVEKPSRYIGNEYNSVKKDAPFSVCLVFPDLYDVGMSHFGVKILYDIVNDLDFAKCERSYLPWPDMQKEMQNRSIPLYSYESYTPLDQFDVVGFTLQYEMSYTNVLRALRLANIPIRSAQRGEESPIIIAGGPCTFNPAPIEDFIDAFLIGDGEEGIVEMLEAIRSGNDRADKLRKLSNIEGVYVPSINKQVRKRVVRNLKRSWAPTRQILPYTEIVHDRAVVEIMRGCTNGCRFCQAGMIYRPVRERSTGEILDISFEAIKQTGYEELSLLSLSSADHSQIREIVSSLREIPYTSLSIPSTRANSLTVEIARAVESVRKSGITIAPEAGTQRLRNVINKGISEEDILSAAKLAVDNGWRRIKLYFMIGLPTETDEDVRSIGNLIDRIKRLGFYDLSATIGVFVPKPHTPFQFESQIMPDEAVRKFKLLNWTNRFAKLNFTDPYKALIEGVLSRGGRELSYAIEEAEKRDLIFADWDEFFNAQRWMDLFEEYSVDIDHIMGKKRFKDEFPWDFIDSGISKGFLWAEYLKALRGDLTIDCRNGCTGCGVCPNFGIENVIYGVRE
ncbi:MAG: radical SAM protein [Athalassotoga sp.]|uniref:radical SAM protein n=1 Tax=Athalassotoga sp. TaxID=2022597 RepID=UPI003D0027B1